MISKIKEAVLNDCKKKENKLWESFFDQHFMILELFHSIIFLVQKQENIYSGKMALIYRFFEEEIHEKYFGLSL